MSSNAEDSKALEAHNAEVTQKPAATKDADTATDQHGDQEDVKIDSPPTQDKPDTTSDDKSPTATR